MTELDTIIKVLKLIGDRDYGEFKYYYHRQTSALPSRFHSPVIPIYSVIKPYPLNTKALCDLATIKPF